MLRPISFVGFVLMLLTSAVQLQTAQAQGSRRDFGDQRRDFQNRENFQDRRSRNDDSNFRDRVQNPVELLVLLGTQTVDLVKESDTIRVGQNEAWFQRRFFRSLQFHVDGNDVFLTSITIRYLNGYVSPEIRVNQVIRMGRSFVLSLESPVSYISEIQMIYRANDNNRRGPAIMKVYGEIVRNFSAPGRDDWVKFDCQPVYLLETNFHSFPVKRREGPFMRIRLHAIIADIEVGDLKIYYSSGSMEEPSIERHIRMNQYSREVDLRGTQRFIDRIEFFSRSTILPVDIVLGVKPRQPHICVEGLQHLPEDVAREPPQSGPPPPPPPPRT